MGASGGGLKPQGGGRINKALQRNNHTSGAAAATPPHRIHITGAARSGTTLMLALMLTCFEIDGGNVRETRLWRARVAGRRVVLTKQPMDERLALRLARLDPRLHVVYMLRDPREVIVSIHGTAPDQYWSNLRAWRESVAAAKPWFDHPRVHVVRYDALARDPDGVQQALAAAMPFLKTVRPFSRFQEVAALQDDQWRAAMGSIRSVSPDALGSWQRHLPRLKAQLQRHGDISGDLIALGFEQDREWLCLLDGVRPEAAPSATAETETLRRRFDHGWRDFVGAIAYGLQRVGLRE
jgi:hypothetical protein